jgi:hypothetical protein
MSKTVLTFGLIAGAILAVMMVLSILLFTELSWNQGEVLGYTTMVLAFLMVFFGVRSYRDNVAGGTISFGRAFSIGALIVVVAAVCYTLTWEIMYFKVAPEYGERLRTQMIDRARARGASPQDAADMQKYMEWYRNPLFNAAITMIEPLPPGLILALISAAVLRRSRPRPSGAG